jgi:hypothetical protein
LPAPLCQHIFPDSRTPLPCNRQRPDGEAHTAHTRLKPPGAVPSGPAVGPATWCAA